MLGLRYLGRRRVVLYCHSLWPSLWNELWALPSLRALALAAAPNTAAAAPHAAAPHAAAPHAAAPVVYNWR